MELQDLVSWARQAWVVWLMLAFAGIVWWTFRPKNKERLEDQGMIPFRDDD
ncbi:MAG: cbb3-type cytochrome oxidase subunit 3 [Rhodospirillales bacterium]